MGIPYDAATFLRTLARAEAMSAEEAWEEAARLWEQVAEANPVEGRFWSQLACARYEAKDDRGAIAAFERALDLRVGFPSDTVARIARCYARLGETDEAIAWLQRAIDLGFRHLDRAREDDAFGGLRADPRFRALVGLVDTAGMSRDEGWQGDARFFAREVKRRAYDPFRHITEERFDAEIDALDRAIPRLSDAQIIVELTRLLRHLGDGHAYARPPEDRADLRKELPVVLYLFEEGLFVAAAAPGHETMLGARVVAFGDRAAEEMMAAVEPLICRDNEQWPKECIPDRLRNPWLLHALELIPGPESMTLTIAEPAGATRTVTLAAEAPPPYTAFPFPDGWRLYPETLESPLPLYLKNADVSYWFEYLPAERVVYWQFNSVRDDPAEPLAAFGERLFGFIADHPVDKLVLDLRWNHGGNTFKQYPVFHRLLGSKVNQRGRLWVIIGRRTFSAAQNGTSFLDLHSRAIFVGEPTGSRPSFIGETVPFALPYTKVRVNVSDLHWQGTWPEDERTWIAPTLYTPPTFAAFRANRDPAMEAILSLRERLPGW